MGTRDGSQRDAPRASGPRGRAGRRPGFGRPCNSHARRLAQLRDARRGQAPGAGRGGPRGRPARDRGPDRTQRLWQEHALADRRRAPGARSRRGRAERRARAWTRPRRCVRLPGSPAAALARRRGQRRLPARACRLVSGAGDGAGGRAARPRGGPRVRPGAAPRALGRDAPAGRDRPGPGARAVGPAARRAVQRPRRPEPGTVQRRAPGPVEHHGALDPARDPQHRRGDLPRRSRRRPVAAAGPGRGRPSGRPAPTAGPPAARRAGRGPARPDDPEPPRGGRRAAGRGSVS